MHIAVKRIYETPAEGDGTRVLVDRLWPRGVSKQAAALDRWEKKVAPSDDLRQWYGHDPDKFDAFSKKYHTELSNNAQAIDHLLAAVDRRKRLTLLTATKDVAISHARVLAAWLQKHG